MNFIGMPLQAIEPHLSVRGYQFSQRINVGGNRFINEYINHDEKKSLQLVMESQFKTAFCKEVIEGETEE